MKVLYSGRGLSGKEEAAAQDESAGLARRHHYVPAGYIGLFAEPRNRNGRLHVWGKEQGKGWISTPNNVAWVEDLYRLGPGDPPHAIEEALAKAESVMIRAIREIDAKPLRPPTERQAGAIISFISLQFVRGPELLEQFDGFTSQVAKLTLQIITSKREIYESQVQRLLSANPTLKRDDYPTYEEARQDFRDENQQFPFNSTYLVRSVIESQDAVFRVMASMQLTFHWVAEGAELVTASRPIVLIPPRDLPPFIPVGIATAEAVLMPLTPKLLFMAVPRDSVVPPIALKASPELATKTNRLLAHQSKQIYSRTPLNFDPSQPDEPVDEPSS